MPAPRWLACVNLHFTNHLLGPFARHMPGMGIVIHTGRKSGRQYRTPVMFFRKAGRVIVALTYGRESQWVKNVLSVGSCRLETQGTTLTLSNPHIVHDEQRSVVPPFVRVVLGLLNVSDFAEMTVSAA